MVLSAYKHLGEACIRITAGTGVGKETLGSGCFSEDNQQHSPLWKLTAFPTPHLCKTPLNMLKPDFIINFFVLYQPIT